MLPTIPRSRALIRALHTARALRNQQWPQLTNILAGEIPPPVQVKSITPAGLLLQDGRLLPSACIFLEGEVLLWDVPPMLWNGWDESKFEVFDVMVPKPGAYPSASRFLPERLDRTVSFYCSPEILLIGTGKSVNPLPAVLRRYLNKLGIQVDIMDSVRTRLYFGTHSLTDSGVTPTVERLHDVQPAVGRRSPGSCRLASTASSSMEDHAL